MVIDYADYRKIQPLFSNTLYGVQPNESNAPQPIVSQTANVALK
ncbi:hypothetical protein C4K03_5441 [Pseudomonas synxantha]|uniref:Uncharacterized protein n=1 Tax=Pseudomonas synxantha TaxID=47883 RepID=A0A3G7UG53_9PSED|nr:hypothetical protein C4K03_5441 [Pseudomonas synxantha]